MMEALLFLMQFVKYALLISSSLPSRGTNSNGFVKSNRFAFKPSSISPFTVTDWRIDVE